MLVYLALVSHMTHSNLTGKQRLFIEHYLDCLNATEAARRAGYAAHTCRATGNENLTKPDLKELIEEGLRLKAMPRDEVIARIGEHARADIAQFLSYDDCQRVQFDLSGSRPTYLVKKATIKEGKILSIELHDAQAALEKLSRMHALFIDRTELTGKDGAPLEVRTITAILPPEMPSEE